MKTKETNQNRMELTKRLIMKAAMRLKEKQLANEKKTRQILR